MIQFLEAQLPTLDYQEILKNIGGLENSHMLCYAIGDNRYGPFTYQGVILTPVVGWTTHHAILEYKGKWYLFHHDSVPSGGKSWLRSLKVCELKYDENGKIITIPGLDE